MTTSKIRKELKIMETVQGGPNIIKLLDVIKDPRNYTEETAFVLEYVNTGGMKYKELKKIFTDYDIRYYIYKLLEAIDFTHS